MTNLQDEMCVTCKYWGLPYPSREWAKDEIEEYLKGTQGRAGARVVRYSCRRYPPGVGVATSNNVLSGFPTTDSNDWCGEYKSME